MSPLLSEIMSSVDFKDEYILKVLKDAKCGNISDETALALITAHERLYKLSALSGDDKKYYGLDG